MEALKKLDWKQIVIALAALGVVGTSDPDTALISIMAMMIVALITLWTKYLNRPIHRGAISLIVYLVAFGLAFVSHTPSLAIPDLSGNPDVAAAQLATLIEQLGPIALALTGSATIVYNALSSLVFERIDQLLPRG